MNEQVEPVPPEWLGEVGRNADLVEGWSRFTQEPEVRGVAAYRADDASWPWIVWVRCAEFVADEPLKEELGAAIDAALRSVPGVVDVVEDSPRGWWAVAGRPTGDQLVGAAAWVVDDLASTLRSHVASFPSRFDDPSLPSSARRFRDVLLSLCEFEPVGPEERTTALRNSLLAFGSETPGNQAAASVLAVRYGSFGRLVLALEDGPELSEIANTLEGAEVPRELLRHLPSLTQAQWDAFTRMVTLIFCAFEDQ